MIEKKLSFETENGSQIVIKTLQTKIFDKAEIK
jgi:hypothetical protein